VNEVTLVFLQDNCVRKLSYEIRVANRYHKVVSKCFNWFTLLLKNL